MNHLLNVALLLLVSNTATAEVTAFKNRDSLRAENPLKCVAAEEVSALSTAADVAAGALRCLKKKRYDDAAELIFVASAYANFDTRRVVDRSAHVAQQTLFSETFSGQSQDKMAGMFQAIEALSPENPRHVEICQHLEAIGPPTYFPKYMIAHGMAVFTDPAAPKLVEPFDASSAWSASLTEFANCVAPR